MTKYSTGFKNNGLIVASDATGAPQWAISLNAIRSDVYGMTYANGKLYVVGAFQNTLTIPPLTLTGSAGDTNSGFVVTINPTTGAALDSVVFSSTAGWTEATIGVNANGEVAVAVRTGCFWVMSTKEHAVNMPGFRFLMIVSKICFAMG